jgi:hypothetical protein
MNMKAIKLNDGNGIAQYAVRLMGEGDAKIAAR